jgi:chemotaxis protein MotB
MRRRRSRGNRGHGAVEHENEERWLLTYADMITLLMALFMVLFSITSVNKAKLQVLQKTLQDAFSGQILPGGKALEESGSNPEKKAPATPAPPIPAIQSFLGKSSGSGQGSAASEQREFEHVKQQIDNFAHAHGLQKQVETVITQRGLVIRLLTDKVLFDSGSAQLKPAATPELTQVAQLLRLDQRHQIMVEGHTDNVPIHGSQFPTNWELSTARASGVVRFLIGHGVDKGRLGASGYAALHPIASNATDEGRSHNRRVEIVLLRSGQGRANQGGSP